MTHFRCARCLHFFPQPDARLICRYETSDAWGEVQTDMVWYASCPECHSDELVEAPSCVECRDRAPLDGTDLCQPCLDRWEPSVPKLTVLAALREALVDIARTQT